ncbi:MFS transporter [Gottfriedia luciferensis]|uniref:MFS transporter n=1 Tax=Gottfriedia luciferensis TaxID=178774 RepID=A0ABX2ZTG5_9BACI|nr:MFS transporter [Gottfriedia luciferensis]ODG92659.1 MFS transporter [Gottfriedia luciferensis]
MKRMLLIILLMSCGATFVTPMFSLYSEYYHLSSLQITILFAIYAVFLLPTLLIVGAKGNIWGLKKVIRISILFSIVSTILLLSNTEAWMLYAGRILEGIAYGAFTGTAVAFLMRHTSPKDTGTALKLSGVTVLVGFGLGPLIAAFMLQYIPVQPLKLPFYILIFFLIISIIILETLSKDIVSPEQKRAKNKISLGVPKKIRSHFWAMSALPIFTVFTLQGIAFALIPIFVKNIIHTSNHFISGLIFFVLLSGSATAQFIPRPNHPITRIRLGILFLLVGTWLIVISGQTSSLPLLWIGVFTQALGGGWTFQNALFFAGKLPEPESRPRVISAFYFVAYIGFIVPVIGVGVLTKFFNLNLALVFLNLFATIIVAYILFYSVKFKRETYSTTVPNQGASR